MRPFLEKYATDNLVLEIGGGHVQSNHSYSDLFPNRYTVDIDPLRKPDVVADVHQLPFGDDSYDHILFTEVLEHCHTPTKVISELRRILKPGGTLILTTRFVYPLHDAPHDYFRFTKYGLQHLFKDWKLIELQPETGSFSAIGALIQRLGFQSNLVGGRFSKAVLYLLAFLFDKANGLIIREYGDIKKIYIESNIITTGYYMVVRKQ